MGKNCTLNQGLRGGGLTSMVKAQDFYRSEENKSKLLVKICTGKTIKPKIFRSGHKISSLQPYLAIKR